jgi:hypothetical protein
MQAAHSSVSIHSTSVVVVVVVLAKQVTPMVPLTQVKAAMVYLRQLLAQQWFVAVAVAAVHRQLAVPQLLVVMAVAAPVVNVILIMQLPEQSILVVAVAAAARAALLLALAKRAVPVL